MNNTSSSKHKKRPRNNNNNTKQRKKKVKIVPETPQNQQRKKRIVPQTPSTNKRTSNIIAEYPLKVLKKVCKRVDRIVPETPLNVMKKRNLYKTPKSSHPPRFVPETPNPNINNIEEFTKEEIEQNIIRKSAKRKINFNNYTNEQLQLRNYLENNENRKPAIERALNAIIEKRKRLKELANNINNEINNIENQGITEEEIINATYVSNAELLKKYCNSNNNDKNSFTMSNKEREILEKKCFDIEISKRFFNIMENANKQELKMEKILRRLKKLQNKIKYNNNINYLENNEENGPEYPNNNNYNGPYPNNNNENNNENNNDIFPRKRGRNYPNNNLNRYGPRGKYNNKN